MTLSCFYVETPSKLEELRIRIQMECVILSAEDMAVVKVAIVICNSPELKKLILSAPYSIAKTIYPYHGYLKQQWNEIIEKTATIKLKNLRLPIQLQNKVMAVIFPIGLRMLIWAEYHERTLGFSREHSIKFLNSSFFTQQGIINNEKTAEELIKDESLNIKQKYKLACLYCFTDHISDLYSQMKEDRKQFYSPRPQNIKQPGLVMFWSYDLMGKVDKLRGQKTLDQYRLEKAVESGSLVAVKFCLKVSNEKDAVIDAAIEAVNNRIKSDFVMEAMLINRKISRDDMIIFRNSDTEESWVPSDYYLDILHFLLSKMREDQLVQFLIKDIEGLNYEREFFPVYGCSRVLEFFLNWPYQDYFMKIAGLMWNFLPESNYADLLLKICDKIESRGETLKFGEEKSYDYKKLLQEFWHQSPERYKRYVFSDQKVIHFEIFSSSIGTYFDVKVGVWLLVKLVTLKNFDYKDRKTIAIILDSVTDEKERNIISSGELEYIFYELMKVEKWELFDGFVSNFFPSNPADEFKRELCFKIEVQHTCIDFIKNGKWDTAESFIRWSSLPEEEIIRLKSEMISSDDGMEAYRFLFLYKGAEIADKFCKWFLSEEKINEFKEKSIFSVEMRLFSSLVIVDKLQLVDDFINCCLSSEETIWKFKKDLAYEEGGSVCAALISGKSVENHRELSLELRIELVTWRWAKKFKGGKWEIVEKFLTWCFPTEEEIRNFKRKTVLETYGKEIHFSLIKSNKWEQAEIFFAWLGLSSKEIKELKKETLFDTGKTMFIDLMHSVDGDEVFSDYGSRKEAIELFLRWYLMDKETVFEFQDIFKEWYVGKEITEEDRAVLKDFDLAIEQHLNDLKKEQKGIKRKSEILMPNKKLCSVELKEREK